MFINRIQIKDPETLGWGTTLSCEWKTRHWKRFNWKNGNQKVILFYHYYDYIWRYSDDSLNVFYLSFPNLIIGLLPFTNYLQSITMILLSPYLFYFE